MKTQKLSYVPILFTACLFYSGSTLADTYDYSCWSADKPAIEQDDGTMEKNPEKHTASGSFEEPWGSDTDIRMAAAVANNLKGSSFPDGAKITCLFGPGKTVTFTIKTENGRTVARDVTSTGF